jgi:exodeoxyribonuclease-3
VGFDPCSDAHNLSPEQRHRLAPKKKMKRYLANTQAQPIVKKAKPTLLGVNHPYNPQNTYKFLSWNVNGIKALLSKDKDSKSSLSQLVNTLEKPIAICLQETKLQDLDSVTMEYSHILGDDYIPYFNHCSKKKGYSGTAVFLLNHELYPGAPKPIKVTTKIEIEEEEEVKKKMSDEDLVKLNSEGRCITVEYPDLYLVNTYVPNSGVKLERLTERTTKWDLLMLCYIKKLQKRKPVVWCGDLNVAILDIDVHNPKGNQKTAGFTPEERASFRSILQTCKLMDTFRSLNNMAQVPNCYTYWGYRFNMRAKDKGWRLDYFCTSESLKDRLIDSYILKDVMGSDHCPIGLLLKRDDVSNEDKLLEPSTTDVSSSESKEKTSQ